jgi:hypothetical protein
MGNGRGQLSQSPGGQHFSVQPDRLHPNLIR